MPTGDCCDSLPWMTFLYLVRPCAARPCIGHLLSQLSRMPRNDLVVCICAAIKTALAAAVASQAGDKRKIQAEAERKQLLTREEPSALQRSDGVVVAGQWSASNLRDRNLAVWQETQRFAAKSATGDLELKAMASQATKDPVAEAQHGHLPECTCPIFHILSSPRSSDPIT